MKLSNGFELHWQQNTPRKNIGVTNLEKGIKKVVVCLLDTGAGNSFIDLNLANELQLPLYEIPPTTVKSWEKIMAQHIDSATFCHIGFIEANKLMKTYVLVIDFSKEDFQILLGTEFFIDNKIVLDFSDKTIHFKD
jgi:hypothetical protein